MVITPYHNDLEYLGEELGRLDLLLAGAVAQCRRRRRGDNPPEFPGLSISEAEVDGLLQDPAQTPDDGWLETLAAAGTLKRTIQGRLEAGRNAGVFLRFVHLCTVFALSGFEADVLLLALAPELSRRYQKLYAYLQDDINRKRPSVDLALRLFCLTPEEAARAREAFADNAPLFSFGLLALGEEPGEGPAPLLSRFLKADDRIVDFLLGHDLLDHRLTANLPLARWVMPEIKLSELVAPDGLRSSLAQLIPLVHDGGPLVCLFHGPEGAGKKTAAAAICRELGCGLLVGDLPGALASPLPLESTLRLVLREARLYGAGVYLDDWQELAGEEGLAPALVRLVERELGRHPGIVFLGSRQPWQPLAAASCRFVSLEWPRPDKGLRQQLWERYGVNGRPRNPADLEYLASAYRFTGGQIRRAWHHAGTLAHWRQRPGLQPTREDLINACQMEGSRHLIAFARKITPKRVWGDLVLPPDTLAQLREFCQQVRYHGQVFEAWGFGQKLSLGKGLVALFSGPSGTGKTLAAEILARELGLDLYKVDLSAIMSKYIGETEKQLARLFRDARDSNAIVLFDEADSLFGKRCSEMNDAHDRYANLEINYLLQCVEEHEGVIILASNLTRNMDPAFLRRMNFLVEFPFPDEDHRRRIWGNIFPAQTPLGQDVDFDFMAQKFKIAGGNIKNVALAAAFRAAEDCGPVCMQHLVLALKREYQKLGKVCEKSDFDHYYHLVH